MRIQTFIQVGGAMITGLWSSYGIASQVWLANLPYFRQEQQIWVSIGIGWLVFVGFVLWGWCSASYKLSKRPIVIVEPECESKYAWLKITNNGHHKAEFSVHISNWQGIELTKPEYNAKWRYEYDLKDLTLKAGESRQINIIQNEGETLNEQDKEDKELRKLKIWSCFEHWYSKIPINSQLKFSVQILTEPELKSPFQQTYILIVADNGFTNFKELKEWKETKR